MTTGRDSESSIGGPIMNFTTTPVASGENLAKHILAMDGDPYLSGHPEWPEIVNEARALIGIIRDTEFDSLLRAAAQATA